MTQSDGGQAFQVGGVSEYLRGGGRTPLRFQGGAGWFHCRGANEKLSIPKSLQAFDQLEERVGEGVTPTNPQMPVMGGSSWVFEWAGSKLVPLLPCFDDFREDIVPRLFS